MAIDRRQLGDDETKTKCQESAQEKFVGRPDILGTRGRRQRAKRCTALAPARQAIA